MSAKNTDLDALARLGLKAALLLGAFAPTAWAQVASDDQRSGDEVTLGIAPFESQVPQDGNEEPLDDWDDDTDFMDLDLADLLEVECTVVSRKAESVQSAAAAVYVISGNEIRRAGHSSIQEALRMVPGMFVSHWTSADWDATIRGFGPGTSNANLAYLNQVLVMVDGVVVYTPLFAGMQWGLQDLDLEHIERIEVIRGPSGILWGANAFHGLINIITKSSAETPGHRLSVRYSNADNFITARTSGSLSESLTFSAFARRSRYDTPALGPFFQNDDLTDVEDWGIQSGGFQLDGRSEQDRTWRLSARGYESSVNEAADFFGTGFLDVFESRKHGGQVAFQFDDPDSGTSVRAAYVKDRQVINVIDSRVDIDQIQLEARRTIETGANSNFMFGVGYDYIDSDTDLYGGFAVNSLHQNNPRAFMSQTWRIPSADLAVTAGVQAIEHEFSGFDLQPSVRLAWAPGKLGTFWASGSRAVRTPSIEEEALGFGTLDAESVVAAEAGWRGQLRAGLGLDVALYYNDYDDVRIHLFDPVTFDEAFSNEGSGHAYGAELAVDVKASERWTLRGAYSIHISDHHPEGLDIELDFVDAQYPVHLLNLRSYVDIAEDWELDTGLYLVERFDEPGGTDGPEYWRGDIRLGWQPTSSLRLSTGVQGFNDPTRSEFGDSERRRLFYVSVDLTR